MDFIDLHFHHGGNFIHDNKKVSYEGGSCRTLFAFDVDKCSYFEFKGLCEDIGYKGDVHFAYLIPRMPLETGLREVRTDDDALQMLETCFGEKDIHLYVAHSVDKALIVEEVRALPSSVVMPENVDNQAENVDESPPANTPTKCSISPLKSKPSTPKVKKTIAKKSKSTTPNGKKVASKPKSSTPVAIPSSPISTSPIISPLIPNNPIPNLEVDVEEYDFTDPRPDSPIPWTDLVGADLLSDSSNDSDYIPDLEVDVEDYEEIRAEVGSSCPRNARKRKDIEDVGDMEGLLDEEFSEEETDIDDVENSDDEWLGIKQKYTSFKERVKKVDGGEDVNETEDVGEAEVIASAKGPMYNSEYEDTDEEIESPDEEDDDVGSRILRKQRRPPKVNERTNYKTFQWVVGMSFGKAENFREAVTQYALAQGYDLKFSISDKKKKRFKVVCRETCKFHVYASYDRKQGNYLVVSVGKGHKCIRNMKKNTQCKSRWIANHYLPEFKENPRLSGKKVVLLVKKEFGILISESVAFKVKRIASTLLHGSMRVHKGEDFKGLFWATARAYSENAYQKAFDELKEATVQGANDFFAQNPNSFCRAFARTESKCDYVVNNMAETFNAYIVESRSKHLIYMLEDIRLALMQRVFLKRQQMTQSDDEILPRIRVKLELEREESRNYTPHPSSDNVFEVSYGLDQVHVDLNTHTCTCRKFDLTGIPCCHAISCASWLGIAAEDFVHPYLKKEKYLRAYEGAIAPNRGESHWPIKDAPLDPPPVKQGPGRPKRNRRRDPHEDPNRPGKLTRHGREMTCSLCQRIGHNKRKCPDKNNIQVVTPVVRGRGRPRGRSGVRDTEPPQSASIATPRGRGSRGNRGRSGVRDTEPPQSSSTAIPRGRGSGGHRGRGSRGNRGRGRGGRGLYRWLTAGEGATQESVATS